MGAAPTKPTHSIAYLRSLSPEEAAQGMGVSIEGVVTANLPYKRSFFLQDASGGIYVECEIAHQFRPGDQIRVTGRTIPGDFLTAVVAEGVTFVAKAGMPTAFETLEPIFSGAQSANWVELEGVIRAVFFTSFGTQRLLMARLQVEDRTMPIAITESPANGVPNWVGAMVRVHAVASSAVNKRRQFLGPRLVATSIENVEVLSPPPENPFALPETPIAEVLNQMAKNPPLSRQVRLSGFVTLFGPQSAFYLQAGNQAIQIRQNGNGVFLPGTHVEVVGFLMRTPQAITLEDAMVRRLPQATAPEPVRVRPADVIVPGARQGFVNHESILVEMEGLVRNAYLRNTEMILELEDQAIVFEASLPAPPTGVFAALPVVGEKVRVRGVCLSERTGMGTPASFRLALRSESDVKRLDARPLAQALVPALGLLAAMGVGYWWWRGRGTIGLASARVEK